MPQPIADSSAVLELRLAWEEVRTYRNIVVGNLNSASMTGWGQSPEFRSACFSLLLALAFSVLEAALQQMREECLFRSRSPLGAMMANSRPALTWLNYDAIDEAREDRNNALHERKILPHAKARDHLAAIENELVAWGIVTHRAPQLWHW